LAIRRNLLAEQEDFMFAQIALPLPSRKLFTYKVPPHLEGGLDLGFRVLVPLQRSLLTGFVVEMTESTNIKNTKEIIDLLDPHPLFSKEMLELTRWVSEYYFCSWGESLKAVLPAEIQVKSELWVERTNNEYLMTDEECSVNHSSSIIRYQSSLSSRQKEILKHLSDQKRKLSWLKRKLWRKGLYADLYDLEKKGWVRTFSQLGKPRVAIKYEKIIRLKNFNPASGGTPSEMELFKLAISALKRKAPRQAKCLELLLAEGGQLSLEKLNLGIDKNTRTLNALKKRGLIEFDVIEKIRESDWALDLPQTTGILLNEEQKQIFDKIKAALESNAHSTFLLHGITGSGKTQVYIEAIREVLRMGKTALVLVPEISLTPQIISRFKANFGDLVGCLHSRLSAGERFDSWRKAKDGSFPIMVGARSAVFSPLENLGLIVVDEEHDSSYKQDDPAPRYNARDVAVMRGKLNKAVVILGSATPSLESYFNAQNGNYVLCQLEQRVEKRALPEVKIVDLREERKKGNRNILSTTLSSLLKEKIEKNEQALLFLNRRGFSTFIKCGDCGHIMRCPRCDITLTFHRTDFSMRCHYCGFIQKAPELCPNCKGFNFMYRGTGTQKMEEELKRNFSQAKVERMDLDTTSKKGSLRRILSDFGKKQFNVLLGTQMITKGLDFPEVTLVGVVSADFSLDLPDFRTKERTFQLLTQVAGRAGRGDLGGEVIIQTYYPDELAIKLAAKHDFPAFYQNEIEQRKELDYPPFSHLILILFSGKNQNNVIGQSEKFCLLLKKRLQKENSQETEILGPAPAPLSKIKNQYRWQIVIKTKITQKVVDLLKKILEEGKGFSATSFRTKKGSCRISVNVDPVDVL
jgi:primosomal protein N' (replication factor Y)